MPVTKTPGALVVIGAAILLGAPAMAAPVTPLSGAARPTVQEGDLAQDRAQDLAQDLGQARFGWWRHGWGHWQSARYRCRPYCGWGG